MENGESEIHLPDGTVITAGGISEDCLTLVIYPVTDRDEDAWKWFLACMEGKGRSIVPYEIYFLNKDGDRLPADGAKVSISLPESMEAPAAFSLDRDGTAVRLASETAGSKIGFPTNGSYYYVLAESAGTVTPATPTPTPGETEPTPTPGETEPTSTPTPMPGETEPTLTPTPGETEPSPTPTPGEMEPTPTPGGTEPTMTPTPGTNGGNSGTGTGTTAQGTGAKTGDETNLAFWVLALLSSAAYMAGVIFRRKRAS